MRINSIITFSLVFFFFTFEAKAQRLASISYSGKKGAVNIEITLKEFLDTYKAVKETAPNTPPVKQFFEEYLRYRIGVEQAYNDPGFIKNPAIRNMFSDPLLKQGFEQLLYKTFAEKKLRKKIAKMDKTAKNLSKNIMLKFYRKNPEFEINFISISFPMEANPTQVKTAKERALKIYNEVKASKKPFSNLVDIYSDDRINGRLNIPRSRHTIYPTIYKKLKTMKNGQISSPIRTGQAFYIVKLNRKIPFGEANRTQIRAAYFDQKRSQILKKYFESLKSKFKIQSNTSLLNNIH